MPPERVDLPQAGHDSEEPAQEAPLSSPSSSSGPSRDRARAARRTITTLSSQTDVWEEFFDHVQVGLALADLTTRYIRVNRAYAELLSRPPEDLVGVPFLSLMHPDDERDLEAQLDALLSGTSPSVSSEQRYRVEGDRDVWVLHGVSLVLAADGEPGWLAISAQDISERRRAEQELRELTAVLAERAVRDPLTGLANRTLVEERLRGTLARDARTGGTTGLLFLDLDGFKEINDRHGHALGDLVLRTVAERLTAAVRPSDTVGRLGGDEFVVLADGATPDGLEALVERLSHAVSAPVVTPTLTLDVGVSIGLATSTAGEADAAGLLAAADKAMYLVKGSSRRPRGPRGRRVVG